MTTAFDIQANIYANAQQLQQTLRELAKAKAAVNLDANDQAAKTKVAELERKANGLRIRAEVLFDTSKATKALDQISNETKDLGKKAGQNLSTGISGSLEKVAGSLGGMLAGVVGAYTVKSLGGAALQAAGTETRMRANVSRGFGSEGPGMLAFIDEWRAKTAYGDEELMQAAAAIQEVAGDANLGAAEIEKLVKVATGIAHTSGLPQYMDNVLGSSEALTRGLMGIDRGLKILGIQTNDTYMTTTFMNGALKDTWGAMSQAEKMQYRYKALLAETADIADAAATDTDSYAKAAREAKDAIHEAEEALGKGLIPIVKEAAKVVSRIPAPALEVGLGALGVAGSLAGLLGLGGVGKWGWDMLKGAGSAATQEAAAATAAATLEAGAATAAATIEAGAATAAATIEAGAATAAATEAAGGAGGLLGKLAQAIPGVSGVGSLGGLAGMLSGVVAPIGVAAAAGLGFQHFYNKGMNTQLSQRDEAEEQSRLAARYLQQVTKGIDWGVYKEGGKFYQGQIVGWDVAQMYDPRYRAFRNAYGQLTGQPYYGQYAKTGQVYAAEPPKVELNIYNQQGVQSKIDASSYAPSNQ